MAMENSIWDESLEEDGLILLPEVLSEEDLVIEKFAPKIFEELGLIGNMEVDDEITSKDSISSSSQLLDYDILSSRSRKSTSDFSSSSNSESDIDIPLHSEFVSSRSALPPKRIKNLSQSNNKSRGKRRRDDDYDYLIEEASQYNNNTNNTSISKGINKKRKTNSRSKHSQHISECSSDSESNKTNEETMPSILNSYPQIYQRVKKIICDLRRKSEKVASITIEKQMKSLRDMELKSNDESKESKKQRRLIRNRISAHLHREKKRLYLEGLENEYIKLFAENFSLKQNAGNAL